MMKKKTLDAWKIINLMTKGKVWFKKGDIHLDVLEPIENPNDYTTEQLTDLIYKKINEVLNS